MEFLSNKPLLITDTILRDAHQSQAATRMTIEDMLPALEQLDEECIRRNISPGGCADLLAIGLFLVQLNRA